MRKKIAKSSGRTIDIRDMDEPGDALSSAFSVRPLEDDEYDDGDVEPVSVPMAEPSERVKVRFEKLVQLIATHNFQEVMKTHPDEDVILSTNLLADLANAHEEPKGERKMPIFLAVGVLIGVILTYILLR